MYSIALLDGNSADAASASALLEQIFAEMGVACKVWPFSSGMEFISEYKPVYDLIVSETEFPMLSGIEVARHVRQTDRYTPLIYLTYMTRYAADGYKVGASDYLLKPVTYAALKASIYDMFRRNIGLWPGTRLIIGDRETQHCVPVRQLDYVEVLGHTLTYQTRFESIRVRGKMEEAEQQLGPLGFFRIHKSYLVNLTSVWRVEGDRVVMAGGREIPLSKKRRSEFCGRLGRLCAAADDAGGKQKQD